MIFLFFKPLDIKHQEFIDVPQLEVKEFTMYELIRNGLKTFMVGSSATKYDDRFIIEDMNYTDKSEEYTANMRAKKGVYKDDKVTLTDDVVYSRENGFVFQTQKVVYDKNNSTAVSDVGYTARVGENIVHGSYIKYNNLLNKVYSKNIEAIYQLKESE
jgi:hypothetical protein